MVCWGNILGEELSGVKRSGVGEWSRGTTEIEGLRVWGLGFRVQGSGLRV